jgi:hypothetical protein
MDRKRELWLHVGLPKTGTSYIQRFMVENRAALERTGLWLGPYLTDPSGKSARFRAAVAEDGIAAVCAALAAGPGERVLISSEQLSDMVDEPGFAAALRAAAAAHFEALRLVIFLRRQDFLKESLYAQVVKNWYAGRIGEENHFDYDHDGRLRRLEAAFGQENVRPLIYRDDAPADPAAALFAAMGVPLDPARLSAIGRQNESLHRRKLMFLARVPKPDPAIQDLAHFMTRVVQGSDIIADDGGRFLMSPQERHDLVARHLEGNRALVARHGFAEPGSFVELPDPAAEWLAPQPLQPAEIRGTCRAAITTALLRTRGRHRLRMAGRVARMRLVPPT